MRRTLSVYVDPTKFPNGRRPRGFGALNSRRYVDVFSALIHTALWTRSPLVRGLQLSDYWAWLRYGVAIDSVPDLRLSPEWDDVDPHQKTILSDELGVGVTTYLMADVLKFQRFVDTHYVVRTGSPVSIQLGRSAKRGPRKAPDYIAMDAMGNFIAVECKGTQASVAALEKAMTSGVGQKSNVTRVAGNSIAMGLVAGLFIPQNSSVDDATVLFWDPSWEDLKVILEVMSPDEVRRSVVRGAVSKQLSLAGAATAARELAKPRPDGLSPRFSEAAIREIETLAKPTLVLDTRLLRERGGAIPLASLSAEVSEKTLAALLAADPVSQLARGIASEDWKHSEDEQASTVQTPDGFRYRLEIKSAV